jgi:outer membrane protein TolC
MKRTKSFRNHRFSNGVVIVMVALLALSVGTAQGRDGFQGREASYMPVKSPSAKLSILEATRLAVEHDPAIFQARQESLQKRAVARQAAGVFDATLTVTASLELAQHELSSIERMSAPAEGNRLLFWLLQDVFDRVAYDLREELDRQDQEFERGTGWAYVPCSAIPGGIDISIGGQPFCFSGRDAANRQLTLGLIDAFSDPLDPDSQTAAENLRMIFRNQVENIIDLLLYNAVIARRTLRRLGTLPEIDERVDVTLDFKYSKGFRSGLVISPELMIMASRENYAGKPMSPAYGGKGVPDSFTSILGVTVDIPLGKGRGVKSTGAAERAAWLNYDASVATQAHTISQSVLGTVQAYWGVVAAQESLELLKQSAATQNQLLEIAEALFEGEEIARVDLDQVRARVASMNAFVAQGRQSLLQARVSLANEIGFEVDKVDDAPLAKDGLPEVPASEVIKGWKLGDLVDVAIANRSDLRSARMLRESGQVLAEAARRDLKRTTDLSVVLAYSALHEGESPVAPMGWASGLEGVLAGGMTGPSGQVNLNIDWPFKNNLAKGSYAEARATAHRAEIDARNMKRVISAKVEELLGALRQAAAEIERLEASVGYYRETLEAEVEKFKAGEATAIDVVLTEEQVTSAQLGLVAAKQAFATLMTELRYELGNLIAFRQDQATIVVEEVQPVGHKFAVRPAV